MELPNLNFMPEQKLKKQKIKNLAYRKFLDGGLIDFFLESDLIKILDGITFYRGSRRMEARSLIIFLYYTGCRPIEALNVKAKDIKKDGALISIHLPAAKRGLPRTIFLSYKHPLVQELYNFSLGKFEDMFLFFNFKGTSKIRMTNKKGVTKEYPDVTCKIKYLFQKYFNFPPYFLRHNRFSKLSDKGVSLEQLRQLKGAKKMESITPYIHLSTHLARQTAKKID